MPAYKGGPFLCTMLQLSAPWFEFVGVRFQVLEVHGPRLRIDKPLKASVAFVVVTALVPTANCHRMHTLAADCWTEFWQACPTVDLYEVRNILSTAAEVPKFNSQISIEELRYATQAMNPIKARGPDGWSNYELKSLPPDLEEALLDLLNCLAQSTSWPSPITESTVTMLSKTYGATDLSQTQPITVLSTSYRVWSRTMARKFLNALPCSSRWCPGNVRSG